MIEFFSYLLNVNIALALLFIAYRFILQKSKNFVGIRYYFIIGIIACLTFPMLELSSIRQHDNLIQITSLQLTTMLQNTADNTLNYNLGAVEKLSVVQVCMIVYLGLTGLFATRLVYSFILLYQMIHGSVSAIDKKYKLCSSSSESFTFLKYIVLGKEWQLLNDKEKALVLAHECQHASGLHSLDVLLVQMVSVFCWFNPTVWLLKKSLILNHEFLVDRRLLIDGASVEEYATLLIEQSSQVKSYSIVQYFSQFSHLKQRIDMMTTIHKKSHKIRIWLAIPILAAILIACNLTDVNESVPEVGLSTNGEKIAFFFEGDKITLEGGISREQLLKNPEGVFSLVLGEGFSQNLKFVDLHLAKGRKSIGNLKFAEEYFQKNTAKAVNFKIKSLMEKITTLRQDDEKCRLVVEVRISKPRYLGAENQFDNGIVGVNAIYTIPII